MNQQPKCIGYQINHDPTQACDSNRSRLGEPTKLDHNNPGRTGPTQIMLTRPDLMSILTRVERSKSTGAELAQVEPIYNTDKLSKASRATSA